MGKDCNLSIGSIIIITIDCGQTSKYSGPNLDSWFFEFLPSLCIFTINFYPELQVPEGRNLEKLCTHYYFLDSTVANAKSV